MLILTIFASFPVEWTPTWVSQGISFAQTSQNAKEENANFAFNGVDTFGNKNINDAPGMALKFSFSEHQRAPFQTWPTVFGGFPARQ